MDKFLGTFQFASVHMMLMESPCRRDDLLALVYTLLHMLEDNRIKHVLVKNQDIYQQFETMQKFKLKL